MSDTILIVSALAFAPNTKIAETIASIIAFNLCFMLVSFRIDYINYIKIQTLKQLKFLSHVRKPNMRNKSEEEAISNGSILPLFMIK